MKEILSLWCQQFDLGAFKGAPGYFENLTISKFQVTVPDAVVNQKKII